MKVSELTGAALDWAVATIEGYTELHRMENRWDHEPHLAMHPPRREYGVVEMWQLGFSTDWAAAGPIIEREKITLEWTGERYSDWMGYIRHDEECFGPTPLIAAMRCYVASKLGDEVNIPEELK
jgi:hypothetical protein